MHEVSAPLFSGGPAVAIDGLLREERFPGRRKLVHEGSRCDAIFVVHSGWLVAFHQLRDGSRQIFNFWLPGEVCGVEFIVCPVAPFCVASMTPCRLTRVSRDVMAQTEIDADGVLTALVCRNSLILRQRVISLGRRNAFVRVAHLLIELTLRCRHVTGEDEPLPLTQREVADSTGLTPAYVNRIVRVMRDNGELEVSREGLRLVDADKLIRDIHFNSAYLENEACLRLRAAFATA